MLLFFKSKILSHLSNLPGWRTNRKIIVIESDDWGSIRMPSKAIYEKMLKSGVPVNKCHYNRLDTLASEKDLQELFNVLISFTDYKGNHPIITANTVLANPDFEKIRNSGFNEYYFEPFTITFEKYPRHQNAFGLWKEGISNGLFYPQFHGREHVNVNFWLKILRENNPAFKLAFDNKFWGLGPNIAKTNYPIHIQASFDAARIDELQFHQQSISEGLELFEKIFGYRSKSFIANNYIYDSSLNETLSKADVSVIQGMKYQLLPLYENNYHKKIRRILGEMNKFNQLYLVRNCSFSPSHYPNNDESVRRSLTEIATAFLWNKPAIISTHRLNFIGDIVEKNRDIGLTSLKKLLFQILKRWPNAEFHTSENLSHIIRAEKAVQ